MSEARRFKPYSCKLCRSLKFIRSWLALKQLTDMQALAGGDGGWSDGDGQTAAALGPGGFDCGRTTGVSERPGHGAADVPCHTARQRHQGLQVQQKHIHTLVQTFKTIFDTLFLSRFQVVHHKLEVCVCVPECSVWTFKAETVVRRSPAGSLGTWLQRRLFAWCTLNPK